jgi:hypothetical protein
MSFENEKVFNIKYCAFELERSVVFGMFLQMYNTLVKLDGKIDNIVDLLNINGYGVANVEEIVDLATIQTSTSPVDRRGLENAFNITGVLGTTEPAEFGFLDKGLKCPKEEPVSDNIMISQAIAGEKGGDEKSYVPKLVPKKKIVEPEKNFGTTKNISEPQKGEIVKTVKIATKSEEIFSALTPTDDITDCSDPLFYYSPHNKLYHLNGMQLYLTYPQCGNLTREEVLEQVEREFGEVRQYVMCYELHKNGGRHIHAYIKLCKKVHRRGSPRWLDINGYHPNIEHRIRSLSAVIKYVTKGGDYISKNIDVDYFLSSEGRQRNGVRMKVCVDILENDKTLLDIVNSYKTPLFGLTGLSRDVELYKNLCLEANTEHNPLREFSIAGIPFTFEGRHKEKQFWIMGPTNTGKTTIIESFMKQGYLGFELPTDDWWEGWHNKIGYVYAKEFHGGIKLYTLNKFLEGGSTMKLKIKGGQLWKEINVPVLIESNQYPHEVYGNMKRNRMDALSTRLNIIVLEAHLDGSKGYASARLLSELEYSSMLDEYYDKKGFYEYNGE